MYLFQLIWPIRIRITFKIYIPLCIYFNPLWQRSLPGSFPIYIPLCIYFNFFLFLFPHMGINLHSTMYLFQLCKYLDVDPGDINLHSTMYLFQRSSMSSTSLWITFTFHYVSISTRRIRIMIRSIPIYIPLCIYFNRYCLSVNVIPV